MLTMGDITKKHEKWLRMAASIGVPQSLVGDVVQEMYLKMCERSDLTAIEYKDGEVNEGYIFLTLRSCAANIIRIEKNEVSLQTWHDKQEEEKEPEKEIQFTNKFGCVECALNNLHWYTKLVFEAYQKAGGNIKRLARETNISYYSLRNTIRDAKKTIKEKCPV
jgi:DNA-directed RNA polymerase specialized sigma24 family protein